MPALAHAAEPAAAFTGGYVGLNAGAAWGNSRHTTDPGCVPASANGVFCNASPDPTVVNGIAVAASGSGDLAPSGFTGGLQAGYNWRSGSFVFGGEADFGAFHLSRSVSPTGVFPSAFLGTTYALTESMSTEWIATIRGRLGMTVTPQLLLYATGGLAMTNFRFSSSYSDNAIDITLPGGAGSGSRSELKAGWALGGGLEWMLHGRWSVKAEYLYVDFGSMNVAVPVSNTAAFSQTVTEGSRCFDEKQLTTRKKYDNIVRKSEYRTFLSITNT